MKKNLLLHRITQAYTDASEITKVQFTYVGPREYGVSYEIWLGGE